MTPVIISSFAIIAFAALIHASFQLSVSVLTLLSGHALGKKTAHRRVLGLMNHFIRGVGIITILFLSTLGYYLDMFIAHSPDVEKLVAAVTCGLMAGLGVAVWAFYYRRGDGTSLWLPRSVADFLRKRSKATKNGAEAFSLGMMSVVAELLFIAGPLLAAATAMVLLPSAELKVFAVLLYLILSILPLLIFTVLVGGGHTISRLQAWREQHKRFLQFVAGGSLIILASFVFVDRILGIALYGAW